MIGTRAFVVGRNVRTRFFSRLIYRWVHRCSQTVQFHLSLWIPTYRHSSNINQKHVRDAIAAGRSYTPSSVDVAGGPNRSIPPLSTPQTSNQTKQKKKTHQLPNVTLPKDEILRSLSPTLSYVSVPRKTRFLQQTKEGSRKQGSVGSDSSRISSRAYQWVCCHTVEAGMPRTGTLPSANADHIPKILAKEKKRRFRFHSSGKRNLRGEISRRLAGAAPVTYARRMGKGTLD